MSFVMFLGDVTSEVADLALSFDSNAYLLDHSNVQNLLANPDQSVTVYTALGDLPNDSDLIFRLFWSAAEIKYCPPRVWSDGKTLDAFDIFDSVQGATEYYLSTAMKNKPNASAIKFNIAFDKFTTVVDQRQGRELQLWNVGCSLSSAVGVDPDQRYGHLLAKDLGLPVSFLTRPSGSIDWCADQILRSDIKPGDIVVWGLTGDCRFSYWQQNQVKFYTLNHRKKPYEHPVLSEKLLDQLLAEDNMIYQGIKHINQVINVCRKLEIKLLIVGLLESAEIDMAFANTPEFIKYINTQSPTTPRVDLGTVNPYPGPQQHQLYANFCKSHLKKLNYI